MRAVGRELSWILSSKSLAAVDQEPNPGFAQSDYAGSTNTLPRQTQGLKQGIQLNLQTVPNAWPVEFAWSTVLQPATHQSRHEPGLSLG